MTGPAWWSGRAGGGGGISEDGQQKLERMFIGRMSWMLNSQCQVSHLHQPTRSSTPARGRGSVNPSCVRRDRDDKHVNNQAAKSTQLGILKRKKERIITSTRMIFALVNQQLLFSIFCPSLLRIFAKTKINGKFVAAPAERIGVRQ